MTTTTLDYSTKRSLSYWQIFKQAAGNWVEDNCAKLSAALAFYTFLSLAPLLVITIKVLALFLSSEGALHQVTTQMTNLVGHNGADAIAQMTSNAAKPGAGVLATSISFVILAISATGVFIELQDSMNIIWQVHPKPHQGIWGFIRTRLLSLAMVLGIAFILLVSFFVSTVITAIANRLAPGLAVVSIAIELVVSFAVVTALFAMMFKVLPDAKILWRNVWVGAMFTGVLFMIGKWGLALYFKYGTSTSAYGAAGSLAAVLIWVYYSAYLIFFGAESTKVYAQATGHQIEPDEHAVAMTEEQRIARGIPHEQIKQTAAADRGRPLRPVRPTWQNASSTQATPGDGGWPAALAGVSGIAAGALLAYLGRDRFDSASRRLRLHAERRQAALQIQDRIQRAEQKLRQVNSIGDRVQAVDLQDRIVNVEKTLRKIAGASAGRAGRAASHASWTDRVSDLFGSIWN